MINKCRSVLKRYVRENNISPRQCLEELSNIMNNIDELGYYRLLNYMLYENIVIPIDRRIERISHIPKEEWIGRDVAFQTPIYYYISSLLLSSRK